MVSIKDDKIVVDNQEEFNKYYQEEYIDNRYDDYEELYMLLEDELSNGNMMSLLPEEIGALTDDTNILFTTDWEYTHETEEHIKIYNYFHCPNYAIINYIDELYNNGYIQLNKIDISEGFEIKR